MRRHASTPQVPPASSGLRGWLELDAGDRVLVKEGTNPAYAATVEVLTDDRTVVWVLPVDMGSRRAFHCSDEVLITVAPQGVTPLRRNRATKKALQPEASVADTSRAAK
jgi:hypothetical protein